MGTMLPNSCRAMYVFKNEYELKMAIKSCLMQTSRGDCNQVPYGPIEDWDVSRIVNMDDLFANAKFFNADISKWDTRRVTSMSRMFEGATAFNRDIADWDVSRVTDMSRMFFGATSFNHDITNWNVRNVLNFNRMFYDARSFQFCRDASKPQAQDSVTRGCFKNANTHNTQIQKDTKKGGSCSNSQHVLWRINL